MKLPNFTRGPWEKGTAQEITGETYVFSGGQIVAVVMRVPPSNGRGNTEANARLITAAPDLYEALYRLTKECKLEGLESKAGFDCWLSLADKALANAALAGHAALAQGGGE